MKEQEYYFNADDSQVLPVPGMKVRYTTLADGDYLKKWLLDPSATLSFPMRGETEVIDAVSKWISFSRIRSSLTVEIDGKPCGMATLYLQAYRKLIHQSEFGIIVGAEYRNLGIGSFLLQSIMRLAKEEFKIEVLHLQVCEGNPAVRLYKKHGFRVFGQQKQWMKVFGTDNQYRARLFMERFL